MCSQDAEYNSQTFTKLESDLVRGNADLKSYQKEVKDRTGPDLFLWNLRNVLIEVSLEARET